MWSYTAEMLNDTTIIELAKKIAVYEDDEANAEFPKKNGCIVTVFFNNSKNFTKRIKDPKGSPDNSLTAEDVKEKFIKNFFPIIGINNADQLYQDLMTFSTLETVRNLKTDFICEEQGEVVKL